MTDAQLVKTAIVVALVVLYWAGGWFIERRRKARDADILRLRRRAQLNKHRQLTGQWHR